jgi:uncharacterized protein YkwD
MLLEKKTIVVWLICIFLGIEVHGQNRTTLDYLALADHNTFRKMDWCHEPLDFERIDYARIHALIFFLTNEIRVRHHLPEVEYSLELENTAMMHARDMVRYSFFSHLNSRDASKKTPNDRASLSHISNPYLAENIMEGYGLQYTSNEAVYLQGKGQFSYTPDGELLSRHTYLSFSTSLLTGWMNSKAHRKNILAREALQLGCGTAFFTDQEFNEMPTFKAVQNFQWYERIVSANR